MRARVVCLCGLLAAANADAAEAAAEEERAFVIVGASPAGLQWARLLAGAGGGARDSPYSYIVLEAGGGAGTFFRTYPRKRRLISANKFRVGADRSPEFAMRHDWHSLLGADEDPAWDAWPRLRTDDDNGTTSAAAPDRPNTAGGRFSREWYLHADTLSPTSRRPPPRSTSRTTRPSWAPSETRPPTPGASRPPTAARGARATSSLRPATRSARRPRAS